MDSSSPLPPQWQLQPVPRPRSGVLRTWPPPPEDPLGGGLLRVREPEIVLLGALLGSPQFIREALEKKMDKVREITSLLPFIEDPHTEFVLLRSCLALPKLMFSLRTVDTTDHQPPLEECDRITRENLTRIMGSPSRTSSGPKPLYQPAWVALDSAVRWRTPRGLMRPPTPPPSPS